jgi:hypothetical protein
VQKANKVPRAHKAEKVSKVALGRKGLNAQKANNTAFRVQPVPALEMARLTYEERGHASCHN